MPRQRGGGGNRGNTVSRSLAGLFKQQLYYPKEPSGATEAAHKYIMKSKTLPQLLPELSRLTERAAPWQVWVLLTPLPITCVCKRAVQQLLDRKLSNALPFPACPFGSALAT